MLTVRLPRALEREVEQLAQAEHKTKSELVKEALRRYLDQKRGTLSPYSLGVDLFGRFRSESDDLSITYKDRLREKLAEKHAH